MAHHRISSLDGRGIAILMNLFIKKIHKILSSCLIALYFDPTTLIEIAVYTWVVLNNKNTNNVETHSCNVLLLVYLGLSIVRCWEAVQHIRYLREYSSQRDKNI